MVRSRGNHARLFFRPGRNSLYNGTSVTHTRLLIQDRRTGFARSGLRTSFFRESRDSLVYPALSRDEFAHHRFLQYRLFIGRGLDGAVNLTVTPSPAVDVEADFDGSGSGDFPDSLTCVAGFGVSSSDADFDPRLGFDESGPVDFSDFLSFVAAYGI